MLTHRNLELPYLYNRYSIILPFSWDYPVTLMKARINSGDHQKTVEAMNLDEVRPTEFNCLDLSV